MVIDKTHLALVGKSLHRNDSAELGSSNRTLDLGMEVIMGGADLQGGTTFSPSDLDIGNSASITPLTHVSQGYQQAYNRRPYEFQAVRSLLFFWHCQPTGSVMGGKQEVARPQPNS